MKIVTTSRTWLNSPVRRLDRGEEHRKEHHDAADQDRWFQVARERRFHAELRGTPVRAHACEQAREQLGGELVRRTR
jgi:hypothetical protein